MSLEQLSLGLRNKETSAAIGKLLYLYILNRRDALITSTGGNMEDYQRFETVKMVLEPQHDAAGHVVKYRYEGKRIKKTPTGTVEETGIFPVTKWVNIATEARSAFTYLFIAYMRECQLFCSENKLPAESALSALSTYCVNKVESPVAPFILAVEKQLSVEKAMPGDIIEVTGRLFAKCKDCFRNGVSLDGINAMLSGYTRFLKVAASWVACMAWENGGGAVNEVMTRQALQLLVMAVTGGDVCSDYGLSIEALQHMAHFIASEKSAHAGTKSKAPRKTLLPLTPSNEDYEEDENSSENITVPSNMSMSDLATKDELKMPPLNLTNLQAAPLAAPPSTLSAVLNAVAGANEDI